MVWESAPCAQRLVLLTRVFGLEILLGMFQCVFHGEKCLPVDSMNRNVAGSVP
jgi:hypothetical protein